MNMRPKTKRPTKGYTQASHGHNPELPSLAVLANEGREDGEGWYDAAHETIKAYAAAAGTTVARVADVLALTSPRQTVTRNVQLASQYLETRSTAGMLPSVIRALEHWEATGEIRGPKTRAFSYALQGIPDAVVIDVWMIRAIPSLDASKSLTRKRYRDAATIVREVAAEVGMSPAATQAAIWVAVRRRYRYVSHAPLEMQRA